MARTRPRHHVIDVAIPQLTLGDRLKISREHAGLGVQQIADLFDKTRFAVSGWESDKHKCSRQELVSWARICDVDEDWLVYGRYPRDFDVHLWGVEIDPDDEDEEPAPVRVRRVLTRRSTAVTPRGHSKSAVAA